MLKINECRDFGEKRMDKIEEGSFFVKDNTVYRRVYTASDIILIDGKTDLFILIERMDSGEIIFVREEAWDTWVDPISDSSVSLEIFD